MRKPLPRVFYASFTGRLTANALHIRQALIFELHAEEGAGLRLDFT